MAVEVRRPGRPAAFGPDREEAIAEFLNLVAGGATVRSAARDVGLSHTPVYSLRRRSPVFAAALTSAQAAGRRARAAGDGERGDGHGTESHYVNAGCRHPRCRAAASTARARRRGSAGRGAAAVDPRL